MSQQFHKYPAKPKVPFTPARQEKFLELFRSDPNIGGRKWLCCEAVGICASTIDHHIRNDPAFAEAYEDARQAWIDEHLIGPALIRARDGVQEPIVGGQFKDEIVAHKRVFSDGLMTLMLRAKRREFRENGGDEGQQSAATSGVLVIPAAPGTVSDWSGQFAEMAKGGTGKPAEEKPAEGKPKKGGK